MTESLAQFFIDNFQARREERAYGQRCGYRMEWFTYGQVLEMAVRFARESEARGIGKGERVMVSRGNARKSSRRGQNPHFLQKKREMGHLAASGDCS